MKKFLFFANNTADAALLLADNLVLMEIDADGDSLEMHFKDVDGHLGNSTMIALTITQHSGPDVMSAISEEIALGNEPMIVIADEINSLFFHNDITAVTNAIVV